MLHLVVPRASNNHKFILNFISSIEKSKMTVTSHRISVGYHVLYENFPKKLESHFLSENRSEDKTVLVRRVRQKNSVTRVVMFVVRTVRGSNFELFRLKTLVHLSSR